MEVLLEDYIKNNLVIKEKNSMRILGLDYGTKTVGVAVSDPLKMTASRWRR